LSEDLGIAIDEVYPTYLTLHLIEDDWSVYSCPNVSCNHYDVDSRGNIGFARRYGKNNVTLLRCRTCTKAFSGNSGTPLFRLRLSYQKFYQMLTSLVRCGSIRGKADVARVSKNTVLRVTRVTGMRTEFNDYMLRNPKMSQAQCDEFWGCVK
jgi:transposase-like protein